MTSIRLGIVNVGVHGGRYVERWTIHLQAQWDSSITIFMDDIVAILDAEGGALIRTSDGNQVPVNHTQDEIWAAFAAR